MKPCYSKLILPVPWPLLYRGSTVMVACVCGRRKKGKGRCTIRTVQSFRSILTKVPNKTLIFHDLPGLEMKFLHSMISQVFHDPYKPCFLVELLEQTLRQNGIGAQSNF